MSKIIISLLLALVVGLTAAQVIQTATAAVHATLARVPGVQ